MKKLLFLLPLLLFAACGKYDDGPAFSLRTKKARLSNTWVLHTVYENGEDKTSDYQTVLADYTLKIEKDNTYSLSYRIFNTTDYDESGTWVFTGDKSHVIFNRTSPSSSSGASDWTITRLKEKELWGEYLDTSTNPAKVIKVHLVPKF